MIEAGLVSVSFRALAPSRIVCLAKDAGLSAIEWGGDVHVPPGDAAAAARAAELTKAAGLRVSSYGSYCRLCPNGELPDGFDAVLDTAASLGTDTVRIWAGRKGSADTDDAECAALTLSARKIADAAAKKNVTVCFEYHPDTLTDRAGPALRLLREADRENLKTYWQPNQFLSFEENLASLKAVLPYTAHIHVFNWPAPGVKRPLSEGMTEWSAYLDVIASDGADRAMLLEFMPDDEPSSLAREARTLLELIGGASGENESA